MSDTFILYGVKFTQEEWVPLLGNLLVIIGVSLTLYIALFVGGDDAPEAPSKSSDTEKTTTPKKAVKAEKTTTTPTTDKKEKKQPPSTQKKEKKEQKEPTTPTTTPKKRVTKKKVAEDLGHIMSPDGRRSMRLKTKTDEDEE